MDCGRHAHSIVRGLVLLLFATLPAAGPARAESCGNPAAFPVAPYPLLVGEAVATCYSGCAIPLASMEDPDFPGVFIRVPDLSHPVMTVSDLRAPPVALQGQNWCAHMFHNEPELLEGPENFWIAENLGQVFGIALDDADPPHVYVTPSTVYGDFPFPLDASGGSKGGVVYQLDGTTGDICDYANLPNTQPDGKRGPGLGNIAYSADDHLLYVTNFDDGLIYRLDSTLPCGSDPVLDVYDHGVEGRPREGLQVLGDTPATRFTPLGRRTWGVGAFASRLYYGVWNEDLRTSAVLANEVWSVGLDAAGGFVSMSARREFALPAQAPFMGQPPDPFSMPVSDIAFRGDGHMLIAERGMRDDTGVLHSLSLNCFESQSSHKSRVLEYVLVGGTWLPEPMDKYNLGRTCSTGPGHDNAAGGVDWDCDGNLWATGDCLLFGTTQPVEFVYGLQSLTDLGNTPATLLASWYVDLDGEIVNPADKTGIGDVELLDCPCFLQRPPVVECRGCVVCTDPGETSATVACEDLACIVDAEGATLDIACFPAGPYPVGTTDIEIIVNDGTHLVTAQCSVEVRSCAPVIDCKQPDRCAEKSGVALIPCDDIACALDPDGRPIVLTCLPGGPYPIGVTDVLVRADNGLEVVTRNCPVSVRDCSPVVECRQPQRCADPGQTTAIIPCEEVACAFDPGGLVLDVTCSPAGPYPIGLTNVLVTADNGAETVSANCQVTVRDCSPVIDCKQPERCADPGQDTATIPCDDIACAFDPGGLALLVNCAPAGPYPIGVTNVLVTADNGAETVSANCQVSVRDCSPVVECKACERCADPATCTADVPCPDIACVVDPDGLPPLVTCTPAGPYPLGPTTVTVRVEDGADVVITTCVVQVRDCTAPVCIAPADITLECTQACGVPATHPAIQAVIAAATGSDSCGDVVIEPIVPPLFPSGCAPGITTPIVYVVTDEAGYEKTCRSNVTVQDTTPPVLVVPPPLVIECPGPEGVDPNDPQLRTWIASASATDLCGCAEVTATVPGSLPSGCAPGQGTVVMFTATDSCGNFTTGTSTITVVDATAPLMSCCGLRVLPPGCPLPPQSAAPPASPGSPLSPASSMPPASPQPPASPGSPLSPGSPACAEGTLVRVDCGCITDACSEDVEVVATLRVLRHEFANGLCTCVVEELPVDCGEILELRQAAPPCPPGSPSSPASPTSPTSSQPPASPGSPMSPGSPASPTSPPPDPPAGPRIISGERIILEVRATDGCGNVSTCTDEATRVGGALPCPNQSPCPGECPPDDPTSPCAAVFPTTGCGQE